MKRKLLLGLAVLGFIITACNNLFFPEKKEKENNDKATVITFYDSALSDTDCVEDDYTYQWYSIGAKILLARQEIIDRGFVKYDAENFDKVDTISQTAVDSYEAGDKKGAIESAEEALLRYNLVLTNGWVAYAAERKESAERERQAAIDERANIASKETFRKGDGFFDNANDFYNDENYSEAALAYVDAEALFAVSRKETAEKRVRAEEAIKIAEEKIE